jgi:hypothetical protein
MYDENEFEIEQPVSNDLFDDEQEYDLSHYELHDYDYVYNQDEDY